MLCPCSGLGALRPRTDSHDCLKFTIALPLMPGTAGCCPSYAGARKSQLLLPPACRPRRCGPDRPICKMCAAAIATPAFAVTAAGGTGSPGAAANPTMLACRARLPKPCACARLHVSRSVCTDVQHTAGRGTVNAAPHTCCEACSAFNLPGQCRLPRCDALRVCVAAVVTPVQEDCRLCLSFVGRLFFRKKSSSRGFRWSADMITHCAAASGQSATLMGGGNETTSDGTETRTIRSGQGLREHAWRA